VPHHRAHVRRAHPGVPHPRRVRAAEIVEGHPRHAGFAACEGEVTVGIRPAREEKPARTLGVFQRVSKEVPLPFEHDGDRAARALRLRAAKRHHRGVGSRVDAEGAEHLALAWRHRDDEGDSGGAVA